MTLSKWFRIGWWAGLLGGLTWLLYPRFSAIRDGQGSTSDILLTIIWLALALAPVFAEIEFLGFKFKAHVEELKKVVKEEVGAVRQELRSAIDIRNQFSPSIVFPSPSSDAHLSELRDIVRTELTSRSGGTTPALANESLSVDGDVRDLFAIRYNLERELRRISDRATTYEVGIAMRRPPGPVHMLRYLVEAGLIESDVGAAIREVYAVCSSAIHGKAPNAEQLAFVRDVAPGILATLRSIGIRNSGN